MSKRKLPLARQVYHLVRPATFAIDGFEGERVFAVRHGDQIKEQYQLKEIGDTVPIKPGSESYVIRVK